MPNTYFQFKQFIVHQERAAMKVCTDACLFGAWVARHVGGASCVLDIGAGTGLLSLMYAQQHSSSLIDAVEIDGAAAQQAAENISASPWSSRITIHPLSIQEFKPDHSYDLIMANPPFFEGDLPSPDARRNNAMHDTSLTLEELSYTIPTYLSSNGTVAILLPYHRTQHFIALMSRQGVHLSNNVLIKQTPRHDYFRSILCFTRVPVDNVQEEEIAIKTDKDHYSEAFISLLKDYYLHL